MSEPERGGVPGFPDLIAEVPNRGDALLGLPFPAPDLGLEHAGRDFGILARGVPLLLGDAQPASELAGLGLVTVALLLGDAQLPFELAFVDPALFDLLGMFGLDRLALSLMRLRGGGNGERRGDGGERARRLEREFRCRCRLPRGFEPRSGLFPQDAEPVLEVREFGRMGDHALESVLRRRLGVGP